MVFITNTIVNLLVDRMVREAWNSVHAVQKQVVQENFRKRSLEGFYLVKFGKCFLILTNINCINWITGIEFHKLQILEVCLLDNFVLYQCWKFDNVRLKPCKDIMHEILVIGLFGHFEKYGFKVFLRSLSSESPNWPYETGRGNKGQGRGVCRKVLQKVFHWILEYTPVHRNVKQV